MWQKSAYEPATRLGVYVHWYEPVEEPGNEASWMYEVWHFPLKPKWTTGVYSYNYFACEILHGYTLTAYPDWEPKYIKG